MRSATMLLAALVLALGAPRGALAGDAAAPTSTAAPSVTTPTAAPATAAPARATAAVAGLVVKVVHLDEARKAIAARAEALGGHVSLATNDRLKLRVPPAGVADLMEFAAGRGYALERTLTREDVTEPIAELEGRLRSKDEMLARLRPLLRDSSAAATLDIERTMTGIVEELERAKGELRVLRDRARFATVDVAFRFPRKEPVERTRSPFEWLNSVDLDRFLADFGPEASR
jgi:hypothetical protein